VNQKSTVNPIPVDRDAEPEDDKMFGMAAVVHIVLKPHFLNLKHTPGSNYES
jgi:hypothetical protein